MLSCNVTVAVRGVYVFLSIVSNHRYARVLELLIYLSAGARMAVLSRGLYARNLLLSEVPRHPQGCMRSRFQLSRSTRSP